MIWYNIGTTNQKFYTERNNFKSKEINMFHTFERYFSTNIACRVLGLYFLADFFKFYALLNKSNL